MGIDGSNGDISHKLIRKFRKNFEADSHNRMALNAVSRGNLQEIAIRRDILNTAAFDFTYEVETANITDQKRAGTCWLFAELNWLRTLMQKEHNIKDIEFSENYLIFWDKFEKANFFLENIIRLRDRPIDDREMHHILSNPNPDGGEWHLIANLIRKYGLVPKQVMPDTWSRENSRFMNQILNYKQREFAAVLRTQHEKGKSEELLRTRKQQMMEELYRIISIFMGLPPEKFTWGYRDKDKNYHQDVDITPNEFHNKYLPLPLDDVYALLSCPTLEYHKTYTVPFFNNMPNTRWHWLNLPIRDLKRIAIKMLKNGETCLYGCDVTQDSHSKDGLMWDNLYDFDLVFKTRFVMDKPTRLNYQQSRCTHAMVLIGVEMINGKPTRWKVENSWGTEVGKKGFFIMSDTWFDEHVFDLVIPKKYLSLKQLEEFQLVPTELPAWHPMA